MKEFVNKNIIEPLEINNIKDTHDFEKYVKITDNETIYNEFKIIYGSTPNITKTTRFEITEGNVPVIRFTAFDSISNVNQGFSTRIGGVSKEEYASLNLTFTRDDAPENVKKNFEIFGKSIGVSPDDMVYSHQTHTCNCLKADNSHRGMGIVRERNFTDIDALVTDEKGLSLVTCYADCIPVIVAEKNGRCIGAAHAGWRGTVGNIAGNMLSMLKSQYSADVQDIIAAVGPGICKNCYEVSSDVAEQFRENFTAKEFELIIAKGNAPDKYQLDLPMANVINLINFGVSIDNIYVSDLCTCCNPKLLFSHRATAGRRGILCNFISIIDTK